MTNLLLSITAIIVIALVPVLLDWNNWWIGGLVTMIIVLAISLARTIYSRLVLWR
jgi:hypothetical protein